MKFREFDRSSIPVCGDAPVEADLSTDRQFREPEIVTVYPAELSISGEFRSLRADVLEDRGPLILAKARHAYVREDRTFLVRAGELRILPRNGVASVTLPPRT